MGYANESGYTPMTISEIMDAIRIEINSQFGTTYTTENFVGTNFYKYFYALAQRVETNEIKTSEIFIKLQDFITLTNERISRPVVTNQGLIDKLKSEGFTASIKPITDTDAGKIFVCVDVDDSAPDYATTKAAICEIIKDSTIAGGVTQGTEVETIVLTNGQSFDFKYDLPNKIDVKLKLTVTLSENNRVVIDSPEDVKLRLFNNISQRYKLGLNFEPQKYFDINDDAPWASDVKLEWSDDDGVSWYSTVYDADYDDLFSFGLADIQYVEA